LIWKENFNVIYFYSKYVTENFFCLFIEQIQKSYKGSWNSLWHVPALIFNVICITFMQLLLIARYYERRIFVHKRIHQNYYNLLTQERAGNQASVQIMVPGITSSPRCAYNVASNRSTKDVVKYVTSQKLLHARIISWLSTITCASGIRNSSTNIIVAS